MQPPNPAPAEYGTSGRAAILLHSPAEGAEVVVCRHASPRGDLADLISVLGTGVAREEIGRIMALLHQLQGTEQYDDEG
jgi:hypothetical protein